jgi:hypothetical protein
MKFVVTEALLKFIKKSSFVLIQPTSTAFLYEE